MYIFVISSTSCVQNSYADVPHVEKNVRIGKYVGLSTKYCDSRLRRTLHRALLQQQLLLVFLLLHQVLHGVHQLQASTTASPPTASSATNRSRNFNFFFFVFFCLFGLTVGPATVPYSDCDGAPLRGRANASCHLCSRKEEGASAFMHSGYLAM